MSNTRKKIIITNKNDIHSSTLFSSKTEKLLELVAKAKHKQALKIAEKHPKSIFIQAIHIGQLGEQETLSPLEFAFKHQDMYLCISFLNLIKNDADLLEQFRNQITSCLKDNAISNALSSLHHAYRSYDSAQSAWYESNETKIKQTLKTTAFDKLREIGIAQQRLPAWALKKLCHESSSAWEKNTEFNPAPAQDECLANSANENNYTIDILENLTRLGTDFFLIRGTGYSQASTRSLNGDLYVLHRDSNVFEQLVTQTNKQIELFISSVAAPSAQHDHKQQLKS